MCYKRREDPMHTLHLSGQFDHMDSKKPKGHIAIARIKFSAKSTDITYEIPSEPGVNKRVTMKKGDRLHDDFLIAKKAVQTAVIDLFAANGEYELKQVDCRFKNDEEEYKFVISDGVAIAVSIGWIEVGHGLRQLVDTLIAEAEEAIG